MSNAELIDYKNLPRVLGPKPTDNMEVVAVRFTVAQIEVIDKLAHNLRISRAKFLRDFFAHMLNLPTGGVSE